MYTGAPAALHLPPSDGDATAQVTERRHEVQCQKTRRGARAVCPWQTEDAQRDVPRSAAAFWAPYLCNHHRWAVVPRRRGVGREACGWAVAFPR